VGCGAEVISKAILLSASPAFPIDVLVTRHSKSRSTTAREREDNLGSAD
jgi:hypothetical protein